MRTVVYRCGRWRVEVQAGAEWVRVEARSPGTYVTRTLRVHPDGRRFPREMHHILLPVTAWWAACTVMLIVFSWVPALVIFALGAYPAVLLSARFLGGVRTDVGCAVREAVAFADRGHKEDEARIRMVEAARSATEALAEEALAVSEVERLLGA